MIYWDLLIGFAGSIGLIVAFVGGVRGKRLPVLLTDLEMLLTGTEVQSLLPHVRLRSRHQFNREEERG